MNLQPEALAVALAIMVFPHPGGPNNKTPARTNYIQFKLNQTLLATVYRFSLLNILSHT